jgi:hypothetical protein
MRVEVSARDDACSEDAIGAGSKDFKDEVHRLSSTVFRIDKQKT